MIERWPNGERIFAYGVEESMIWRNRQERRVDHLRRKFGLAELASGRTKTADINPLAVSLSQTVRPAVMNPLEARVGADVHEVVAALSVGSLDSRNRKSQGNYQTQRVSHTSHEDS